ncbi:MAG TPA: ABC transporter substrate-binding protein [Planctomycetota bacterium]|nr:ABC transporter substrate-binding protein [Planctomycetota bacterium]
MNRRVRIVCGWAAAAALVAAAAGGPSRAAAGEVGPMEQIRESTDKLLAVLSDPALKTPERKAERHEKVCAAIDERFHWADLAQRTLARHWAPRTPEEREEFTRLFHLLLRHSYLSKIESYSGERIHYKGERIEGNYARVEVVLVTTKNVDIPIEYSAKKYDGGGWLVYDVAIEGVRLVNNYRTQFASMLNSMSYPKFLEKLKAKVAEMTKED